MLQLECSEWRDVRFDQLRMLPYHYPSSLPPEFTKIRVPACFENMIEKLLLYTPVFTSRSTTRTSLHAAGELDTSAAPTWKICCPKATSNPASALSSSSLSTSDTSTVYSPVSACSGRSRLTYCSSPGATNKLSSLRKKTYR